MKTKILSITVVLSILLTMFAVPVMAEAEDIIVYSQDFDSIIGAKSGAIRDSDEIIATIGENAKSASTVKIVSEPENGLFLESFAAIADTSGLDNVKAAVKKALNTDILSGNENDVMTVSVENHVLKLDKTDNGSTGTVYFDLSDSRFIGSLSEYTVEFDLKTAFTSAHTVNVTLGADFSIRCADFENQLCTIEWHNGTSWVNDDKTQYDFSDFQHLTLAVRTDLSGTKTVDLYVGKGDERVLAYENVPQRNTNNFKKLGITVGSSAICQMHIDNVGVTTALPAAGGTAAEEDAVLSETDGFMQIAKLYPYNGTGTGFEFDDILCGADDYTASMNIYPKLTAGSINVYMGAFFEFVRTSEGVYRINYREGAETSNKVLAENIAFTDYRNLAIKVTDGASYGLYLDGELIKDGIIARDNYSASNLYIHRNNGMMGNVYVDDVTLTLHAERAAGTSSADGDDFESFTTGPVVEQVGSIRTTSTPDKGFVSVEKVDETHGNALRLYSPFNGSHTPYHVSRNYSDLAKTAAEYTVEFEVMLRGKQSYNIAEKRSGGGGFKINLDLALGYVKYQKDSVWVNAEDFTVEADTWYKIRYEIDTAANLADVYINDTLLVEDLDSYQSAPCGGLILSTNKGTQGSMYFDNLKVTVNSERDAYVSAVYEDGVISVDGYMPTGDDSRLFIAYFDSEQNGQLLDVDIIPCQAGKLIEEKLTEIPEGAVMINVMLWKADITPVCANSILSIVEE